LVGQPRQAATDRRPRRERRRTTLNRSAGCIRLRQLCTQHTLHCKHPEQWLFDHVAQTSVRLASRLSLQILTGARIAPPIRGRGLCGFGGILSTCRSRHPLCLRKPPSHGDEGIIARRPGDGAARFPRTQPANGIMRSSSRSLTPWCSGCPVAAVHGAEPFPALICLPATSDPAVKAPRFGRRERTVPC
jgi:hypothetical protein